MTNRESHDAARRAIVLGPDEGRAYELGTMRAVFKADGDESSNTYSISEWTLDPGCVGVGAHSHGDNDDIFFVLEGEVTFLLGEDTIVATPGTFLRAPHDTLHDFSNRGDTTARFLNIYVPGGFEDDMPSIVEWFATHDD